MLDAFAPVGLLFGRHFLTSEGQLKIIELFLEGSDAFSDQLDIIVVHLSNLLATRVHSRLHVV